MAWFLERQRYVLVGDLRACAAGGSHRGSESACGGQGLWFFAKERAEVPVVHGAVRLSAPVADHAAQARFVPGRD
jgi:hypothetical protein